MGTIKPYETAAGPRYRARYRKPDNTQTDKRGFKTKKEAQLFLASVEVSKARGEYFDPKDAMQTVGDLGPSWLENKQHSLKPSSYAPLATAWRVYVEPKWGSTPIGRIRPSAVEDWIRELSTGRAVTARQRSNQSGKPKSASVVIRAVGVLSGILERAKRDGRIPSNPAQKATNLPRKVSMKPRRYLTHAEVFRFASFAPDFTREVQLVVLSYTGIRWGESVGLRVRDVNFLRRRLQIAQTATEVEGVLHVGPPKSWEERGVPLPDFLLDPLSKLCTGKGPNDLVFAGPGGGFMMRPDTSEGRASWFLTALRRAELDRLTPHDLKHTAASLAVSAGANVKALQRMLGHKSAAMTLDTYADLFDDDLDSVATRLDEHAAASNVGKVWAHAPQRGSRSA
ncbi:Site-specific recombinase XerD [Plantibacter flavus]|uniref:Site-specific recombinase XerD n=1 Tax=Plantibacter flavus TaxID=150123 RepID=A0A3N2C0S7_9MICO|nr:tyrosine-type recombinase/integrase [Plantibacter flavus]ROR81102.1 site-specific recombinase XerD [Plantibacter flavus]SMG07916.1 Site-specific recombinase XerD [Plantibacter flavus]